MTFSSPTLPDDRHQWRNPVSGGGDVIVEKSDCIDELGLKANFLFRLSQRGLDDIGVADIHLAAGKRNLTGMGRQLVSPLREEYRCLLSTFDNRDEHCRGSLVFGVRQHFQLRVELKIVTPRRGVTTRV